jgi:hypothetical protein
VKGWWLAYRSKNPTVVLKPARKGFAHGGAVIEVVDGQQRLTTLAILLKAVRKGMDPEASKDEAKYAAEIDELLVKGDELSLLLLNHAPKHTFTDYLRDGVVPAEKARSVNSS